MSNETPSLAHHPIVDSTEPISDSSQSKPVSRTRDVNPVKSISRSVPNSSKKRYQENYTRRRSRTHSIYDPSTSCGHDVFDVATTSVRFSNENLVDGNITFSCSNQMTFPRPIASINVSRVASASSDVTEPIIGVATQQQAPPIPVDQARLRPSIISLFGRIVSRNNSNVDSNADGDIGIRARILRAFSYVGKSFPRRIF